MQNKFLKFDTKRCFGVEIEIGKEINRDLIVLYLKKNTRRFVKKSYYRPTVNNSYWDVKHDGSCGLKVVNGINEGGYEINSYKASGINELKEICKIVSNMKTIGVKVNNNCGFHLHVEVADFSEDVMGILLNNWIHIEELVFDCVPKKRKNNKYCQRMNHEYLMLKENFRKPIDFWNLYKPKATTLNNAERKRSLNINNYYRSLNLKKFNRKTVEFRFMESTLCEKNIKNWVRFLVNFVEFCKNRSKMISKPIASVEEFLEIVGLGSPNNGYELSEGLTDTRNWILKRMVRHSKSVIIKEEAKNLLIKGNI